MGVSDDRAMTGGPVLRMFLVLPLLGVLSCAIIAGTDEGVVSPTEKLDLQYVETLKNQESLRGSAFRQTNFSADPTRSLVRPSGVYADAFRVYVTDLYSSGSVSAPRILIFDRNAQTTTVLPIPPSALEGRLLGPTGVTVSGDTVIFVADGPQGKVFGYDRSGTLVMVLGKMGELVAPVALALDARRDRLYVADSRANQVKVYTTLGNRLTDIGGDRATGHDGLRSPSGVALDREGAVYVLDSSARRVHVYDADGQPRRVFPVSKGVPGGPWQPKSLAVDSAGHVYVTDSVHNTVLIFDREGTFITTWGKSGSSIADFWTPAAIYIDESDKIYVADQTNGRVQVFQFIK